MLGDDRAASNFAADHMPSAVANGSGAAFNIYQVPEGIARHLLLFLIGVCMIALVMAAVAMVNSFEIAPHQIARASESVDRASDRLEENTRYLVQVAYWGQRAEVAATAAGVKLPPFPQPTDRRRP
jgi:hypothetical protein